MITSTIGRIFMDAYNEKNGTSYDAKTFFVKVYHPLFFDSPKYLTWVKNSPFVQGLRSTDNGYGIEKTVEKEDKTEFKSKKEISDFVRDNFESKSILDKKHLYNLKRPLLIVKMDCEWRSKKLEEFISKVDYGIEFNGSLAIGFPAAMDTAPTSGQVSNISFDFSAEEVYLSWIGSSFSLNFGGYSVSLYNKKILLDIFEGWKHYRKVVDKNKKLEGKHIDTWNTLWLSHRYSKSFKAEKPFANFSPFEIKDGQMVEKSPSWIEALVMISMNEDIGNYHMMSYVYKLGKTNKTIGFLPLYIEQIKRPYELYQRLFKHKPPKSLFSLWDAYGFKKKCECGIIDLRALEPQSLKQYVENGKEIKSAKDESQAIKFNIYKCWLLAMLNNDELWEKSIEFAKMFDKYLEKNPKKTTQRKNSVEKLLSSKDKLSIVQIATEMLDEESISLQLQEFVKTIHMMKPDNLKYFMTLIKFQKQQ